MIVALEGAPGVGKSTTSAELGRRGAYVVPEVNQLFARPDPQPTHWYYDRQVARWEMARLRASLGGLAVLDGDPLQPIWFAWAFAGEGWPSPAEAIAFFRSAFAQRRMQIPDRYALLHVAEETRRARMLARERARGLGDARALWKTERYARLVRPQMVFFEALASRFPGWVTFVQTDELAKCADTIQALRPETPPDGLEVLDFIAGWLPGRVAAAI